MMAEPADFEIIAGVGNEVFYFFGSLPLITVGELGANFVYLGKVSSVEIWKSTFFK